MEEVSARSPKSTTGRFNIRPWMRVLSAVAPRTAGRVGRAIFFHPIQARSRPEWDAVLVRGEPFELRVRNEAIRGSVFGEGPVVLLAHGWGGHSGQMSSFIEPLVQAGYRVVAFDMPAHGRSSGRITSLLHFAEAIDAVHRLFPGDAIIAHSFGAAGTMVAMDRRKIFERLVFVAPPARFETFWQRFRAGVGMSSTAFAHMRADAERWLDIKFDDLDAERIAPRLSGDLLVIHDNDDKEIAVNEARTVALTWPLARLEVTHGLGHVRILHDPRVIARALEFIGRGHSQSDTREKSLE